MNHQKERPDTRGNAVEPVSQTSPTKGKLNMQRDSTAVSTSQEPTTDDVIFVIRDKLSRIKDLNELIFMAGEGMLGISRDAANAICAGSDVIKDALEEVCEMIDGRAA